jgi:hypothetical protein
MPASMALGRLPVSREAWLFAGLRRVGRGWPAPHRWWRLGGAVALVGLVVVELGLGGVGAVASRSRGSAVFVPALTAGASAQLPLAARAAVSRALGRDDRAFGARSVGGGFVLRNAPQRFVARFSDGGVVVRSGRGWVGLSLRAYGYRGRRVAVVGVAPRADANRVVYPRGGLVEWYANGPLGLEQGFTLRAPPAVRRSGPLTLELALSGNLRASLVRGGLRLGAGSGALLYTGLAASDTRGRELRSWLALRPGDVVIRIADRGAVYPLRIDPFVQQGAKLVGSGASGFAYQGASVALSGGGNTALIGGPDDDAGRGAVWVFTRANGAWSQQEKLVGSGAIGNPFQGVSVSLSADGNTALIGGPRDDGGAGAGWVFVRASGVWSQQAKLVGSGGIAIGGQGVSVSLSADGNTALIGGPNGVDACCGGTSDAAGAAWVFARVGGVWSQQAKLVGSGVAPYAGGFAGQGSSVALSNDGSTALIGGPSDDVDAGAAWVFTRANGVWSQQGPKLVGPTASGSSFGVSVALSGDGSTALIGSHAGAAWVFTQTNGVWSHHAKLVGSAAVGDADQGARVALSGDGGTALIGGPHDNAERGAVWVFTNSSGVWTQQGSKLVGTGVKGMYPANQGSSVSLSGDGNTALEAGPADGAATGAAWVFVRGPRANAKLTGIPRACAQTPFTAHITGSGISSVRWLLDGKQIRGHTVHRGTRYFAMITLSPASHNVTVKVRFQRSSLKPTRVFRRAVSGCTPVSPEFTG